MEMPLKLNLFSVVRACTSNILSLSSRQFDLSIVVRNYGCKYICKNIKVVGLSACSADPLYFGPVQSPRVRAF